MNEREGRERDEHNDKLKCCTADCLIAFVISLQQNFN